jgi:uncharacterized protein (TIGR02145 family)
MSDAASTSVTLSCDFGVQLSESTATEFIIALPPVLFSKGFTMTVIDDAGNEQTIETDKENSVLRSSLLVMPEVTLDKVPQTGDYVDEYGINHGPGVKIGETVWAPVNCGYHATDFKYGKLYQWGRKYGQGYEGKLYLTFAPVDYKDSKIPTIREGDTSVRSANNILNEDIFYIGTGDFAYEDWANPRSEGSLWNLGTESNPIKSEYDPCPDGWRVPTWKELSDLGQNSSTRDLYNGQIGLWFSGINEYSEEASQVFLPAAGWRYDDRADRRGDVGNYWCSRSRLQRGGDLVFSVDNTDSDMNESARATGESVRCVKISPELPAPSVPEVSGVVDLSKSGTANSYIVSAGGSYKLRPTKGNSASSVGTITSVEVVWKTFGTDDVPNIGDLITDLKYEDGYIHFVVPSQFAEGNVLIAAKNKNGVILWSWHIWLTDNPQSQKYSNNYEDVGIMMDRNLGATSATPGTSASLGLLYQWGRKDPFIGSSSISNSCIAKSTIQWPEPVLSDSYTGTIKYAIANPTVFIMMNDNNNDWYYSNDRTSDYTRWTESTSLKSIYDPCPVGWRVPDGGDEGIWAEARGSSYWVLEIPYYIESKGINFCGEFGDDDVIWYPMAGYYYRRGELSSVGSCGTYWSASHTSDAYANCLYLYMEQVYPTMSFEPAYACSVRCVQVTDEVADL